MSVSVESLQNCFLNYREISEDIELMSARLDIMSNKTLSPHTTHITGMPSAKGGAFDEVGQNVSKNTDLENLINKKTVQAKTIYQHINNIIMRLYGNGSAKKRAVLQARYLDLMNWYDVSALIFLSEPNFSEHEESYLRRTYKIHKSALLELSELVNQEDLELLKSS